jgi:hypothetical protein
VATIAHSGGDGIAQSYTHTGLTTSDFWYYAIVSRNRGMHASGVSSPSLELVVASPPGAPATCSGTVGVTSGVISVAWTIPDDDGGTYLEQYVVSYAQTNGGSGTNAAVDATTLTDSLTGLNDGDVVTVDVVACNSVACGDACQFTATPASP